MNDNEAAIAASIERINNAIQKFRELEKIKKALGYTPAVEAYIMQLQKIAAVLQIPETFKELNNMPPKDKKQIIERLEKTSERLENAIEKSTSYSSLLQGKGTNALAHVSKKSASIDTLTGIATLETPTQVLVKIDDFANRNLNVQARQLFDILALKITRHMPYKPTAEQVKEHRLVTLTVEEFMAMRGLKDKKAARKQLEEAAKNLYSISLEWDEEHMVIPEGKTRGRKTILHHRMRIADNTISDFEKPIKNGQIAFKFSFDLAEYLGNAYIMQYPHALFTLNSNNNPHSYYLGRKMALHHNMNLDKENANRISVQSLLEALPDMPTYEEVMNNPNHGHVRKKIIDTFERDLEALLTEGILSCWEYCNNGGVPLTDEQVEKYKEQPKGFFDEWVNWLVHFELANYPDQTERLKEIEHRKKIAAKKK